MTRRKPEVFDADLFARALSETLRERRKTTRQAGAESGTNASTIVRVCQGRNPDVESFARLCRWMGTPFGIYFKPKDTPE